MSDFVLYKDSLKAINDCIEAKEKEVKSVEDEIFYLKQARRSLSQEFQKSDKTKSAREIG